jgi:putative alpha-1,2-mannosidase
VLLFDELKWKLNNGKKLAIRKRGNSRNLKAIEVNHKTMNGYFVSHDLFKNGGMITMVTE